MNKIFKSLGGTMLLLLLMVIMLPIFLFAQEQSSVLVSNRGKYPAYGMRNSNDGVTLGAMFNSGQDTWALGYVDNMLSTATSVLTWNKSGVVSGITGDITGHASKDIYRNPYYDGSQSVTVASATVTGSAFSVGGSTLVVADGKVGIGISAPLAPLHAVAPLGSIGNALILQSGQNGTNTSACIRWDGGTSRPDSARICNYENTNGGDLQIMTSTSNTAGFAQERVRISGGNGFVGIGTTAPTAKVSVSSSTASTSFYSIGGAMTKAEILAYDPPGPGVNFYCTNCVASTVCISTGTAVADFADIGDRTVACN